ncbi:ABC transporter permease [Pseudonocardia xishanensis]|uniref:ABC transmembrane type-1 domain-containing protein n=1 Tax=Pseudonocardia xishanensis TaxID=630995 RepID=A0ABP8S045_9PSEU
MTAVQDAPAAPSGQAASTVSNAQASRALLRKVGRAVVTIVVALIVLGLLWQALLLVFDVSEFVGKSPIDVFQYLFSADPPRGVRPASMSAEQARAESFGALGNTLLNALIGFVSGMVIATAVAVAFVLWKPVEFAFMPIAMLLRSVPLVAMAPLLLLIFGQGKVGIAVIAAIVVLFPVLVNVVVGLNSASPQSLDLIKVNGGTSVTALLKVRIPAALPEFLASVRISVPGAFVGAMLAEWLVGFSGMGGVLSGYRGAGNYGGVWTIVTLSVVASIVIYEIATIVEAWALSHWGPNAGVSAG